MYGILYIDNKAQSHLDPDPYKMPAGTLGKDISFKIYS